MGDNDTRKIMAGYICLINKAVIDWNFRSQETVTLSVIESEYLEITEVCCKILFVSAVLLFIGVVVEYPITVHVEQFGYIFLLDNTSVPQWTKHIDVNTPFIREYVEDGAAKI